MSDGPEQEKIYLPVTDQSLPKHVAMGFHRYSKFKKFEEGGVANLRTCLDRNLGRQVLMKYLHPHLKDNEMEQKRFLREARVTAQLQHPATVPVYELGRDDKGEMYFTMKQVRGITLRNILENLAGKDPEYKAKYPRDELLNVFIQVAQAVAYAHSQGVIHRDLKPANIIVGAFGEVMLLDWGLAKVFDAPDEFSDQTHAVTSGDLGLTHLGKRYGTPLYMSPEQARGETDVDERCDIYLLGGILYEILTYKSLIWGDDLDEVLKRVINEEIPSARERSPERNIPPELNSICEKALQKEPQDRYRSVVEMIEDVRRFNRDQEVSVHKYTVIEHLRKWRHRHLISTNTILAFLLGAMTVLVLYFSGIL